jgi:hypothetical protein
MADDDDVIAIDIVPQFDEKAAEEATGKLKDKFKGVGKTIGDALGSDVGEGLAKNVADKFSAPAAPHVVTVDDARLRPCP